MNYWYAKNNISPLKATMEKEPLVDMTTLGASGGATQAKAVDADEEIKKVGKMVADKKKEAEDLVKKVGTGGLG